MEHAFTEHFSKGAERVVIVGTDCPANDWQNMRSAFNALEENECVIGPAGDGGYYLIGLCRAGASTAVPDEIVRDHRSRLQHSPSSVGGVADPAHQLFHGIDWGTNQVFDQTMNAASDLSVHLLPALDDVDLPEHIPQKISVIIPALNEEAHIAGSLEKVREAFNVEIIVVDGGSVDGTQCIADGCLECTEGRAAQQNMGASQARGELLLFLHADTLLPEGWDWIVRQSLANPAVTAGAFTFRIQEQMRGLRFIEAATNWRARIWKMPYGDQGLFMRRDVFEKAGAFPDMPIMEDYALVRTLRRMGEIEIVPQAAHTSGRRWQQHGVLKVTLINKLMILGYHLGISPEKLANFYRKS
jgi:rSAM/selenodomain-associated transferase 2